MTESHGWLGTEQRLEIARSVADHIRATDDHLDQLGLLADRIEGSLNGLFLSFQNAMGIETGDVAALFASDSRLLERLHVAIVGDIFTANRTAVLLDWDGEPCHDLGKTMRPSDIADQDIEAIVDGYLRRLSQQAELPTTCFDQKTKQLLVNTMRDYVDFESIYYPSHSLG